MAKRDQAGIFISYRHTDTANLVDRLDTDLAREFGRKAVYRDHTGLKGGERWTAELEKEAKARRLMLVVIGAGWKTAAYADEDREGELRLSDKEDWVRKEIAFSLGVDGHVVIPVLVDQVAMPSPKWLAKYGLERLHEQQAMRLRNDEYVDDCAKIVARLDEVCPELRGGEKKSARKPAAKKPTVSAGYRAWLREQCGELDLLGLQLKHGQAARLNQIYVPLATPAGEEDKPQSKREPAELRREGPRQHLLLDLLDKHSLYVSGAPGSGKSTFCRWAAWLACTGAMPAPAIAAEAEYAETFPEAFRKCLPVLLRLRDFWTCLPTKAGTREISRQQLEKALHAWWLQKQPANVEWPDLLGHLRQGSALLLIDGVDEVPLTHGEGRQAAQPRAMLLAGLADAIPGWLQSGNRVLVTSRPYGINDTECRKLALRNAPIDDLAEPVQALLVRRWFHILADNPAKGAATAQDMLNHLAGRDELSPLTANPMLLTAMCIIYHQGKRLPQDKYDLYDRIVDNVLHNRYANDPVVIDMVRNRLSVIAHGMHTGAGLGEERTTYQAQATYAELDKMLQAYQDQKSYREEGVKTAVETREQLLSDTGLILPRGDKQAGFYHLSFQEFLAAQRVLDVDGDRLFDVFVARAAAPEWRNTLSFLFASLLGKSTSPERSIRLLGRMVENLPVDGAGADGWVGLALVVADCLEILIGRDIRLQAALEDRFRQTCISAINREVPIRERWVLGRAEKTVLQTGNAGRRASARRSRGHQR